MDNRDPHIMIIYTGGTIGMLETGPSGELVPMDFKLIDEYLPELKRFGYEISSTSFETPIDSSNAGPESWIKIAEIIEDNYYKADGFVILHGTDTMAYSASALSFMLENLEKPVIFTGSQLPIGRIRTDGSQNIISAVEIAAARSGGRPSVPEVSVYFENKLFRANRTTKISTDQFHAFESPNYPELAQSGVYIKFNYSFIHYPDSYKNFNVVKHIDPNVFLLKLYPGIQPMVLESILDTPGLRGLVMETFGAGNAPSAPWFIKMVKRYTEKGIIFLNISQCQRGSIRQGLYQTSSWMEDANIINGMDMTTEAAITKMMYLLGGSRNESQVRKELKESHRGEITFD